MPVYPGQLRYIRKNMFHAVYLLDPATECGAEACHFLSPFIFLVTFEEFIFCNVC